MNRLLLATLSFVLLAAQTAKADYSIQIPKDVQNLLKSGTFIQCTNYAAIGKPY